MDKDIAAEAKEYPLREVTLHEGEHLVKGMYPPQWMPDLKRGSAGIFEKNNTSVTRMNEIGLNEAIKLVKADIEIKDGVPNGKITAAVGVIAVADVVSIGKTPLEGKKPPPVIHFRVYEEKTEKNEHHAEIVPFEDIECSKLRKNVSTGYSRKLRDKLHNYLLNAEGNITEENPPDSSSANDTGTTGH
ncbi:hypothetical protein [Pseudomonas sp. TWP3-1]|uniref:hypothetical protein n=1 Tax=Pseudomonas sp. TWP3-1 TaxID=2804631 RepID=UPI003CF9A3D5